MFFHLASIWLLSQTLKNFQLVSDLRQNGMFVQMTKYKNCLKQESNIYKSHRNKNSYDENSRKIKRVQKMYPSQNGMQKKISVPCRSTKKHLCRRWLFSLKEK